MPPSDVLDDFYSEAADSLVGMASLTSDLAHRFRRHELKDAQEGLSALTGELGQFLLMLDVLCGPVAVDPEQLRVEGVSLDDQVARLGEWLGSLVEAQGNQDWLTIADILELDLEPVLRAWGPMLRNRAQNTPAA